MRRILALLAIIAVAFTFALPQAASATGGDPALDGVSFDSCVVTHPQGYEVVDNMGVHSGIWTISSCMAWGLNGPFTLYGPLCWQVWGNGQGTVIKTDYGPPFFSDGTPNAQCPHD